MKQLLSIILVILFNSVIYSLDKINVVNNSDYVVEIDFLNKNRCCGACLFHSAEIPAHAPENVSQFAVYDWQSMGLDIVRLVVWDDDYNEIIRQEDYNFQQYKGWIFVVANDKTHISKEL